MAENPKEEVVQAWFESLVAAGSLYETILGKALLANGSAAYVNLSIPFDLLIREALQSGGREVLTHLPGAEIVSATQNASRTVGEELFPDLVLVNKETKTLIIVELKRSPKSEREAGTQLLAYELEVLNLLPFASHYDVLFCVVSTDYDLLLSHSLASLASWHHRKILCLKLSFDNEPWQIGVILPDAWHRLGRTTLSEMEIQTFTIDLNPMGDTSDSVRDIFETKVNTAADVLIAECERGGGSGFVFHWLELGDDDVTLLPRFTVASVNPWALRALRPEDQTARATELCRRLDEMFPNADFQPRGLARLKDAINDLVLPEAAATGGRMMNWSEWLAKHRYRSFPLYLDYFGVFADFAKTWVTHPIVRREMAPDIGRFGFSWRTPKVGLPILWHLTRRTPFSEGKFSLEEVVRFGVLLTSLGNLVTERGNAPDEVGQTRHQCAIRWKFIEFQESMRQIMNRVSEVRMEAPPGESGRINVTEAAPFCEHLAGLQQWFMDVFLTNDGHRTLFKFGCVFYEGLDIYLRSIGRSEAVDTELGQELKEMGRTVVEHWRENWDTDSAGEVRGILVEFLDCSAKMVEDIDELLDCIEGTQSSVFVANAFHVIRARDVGNPPVTHKWAFPIVLPRDQITELRHLIEYYSAQDGLHHILSVNANSFVAVATEPFHMPRPQESEVWVLVDIGGIQIAYKHRWEDLENGLPVWEP